MTMPRIKRITLAAGTLKLGTASSPGQPIERSTFVNGGATHIAFLTPEIVALWSDESEEAYGLPTHQLKRIIFDRDELATALTEPAPKLTDVSTRKRASGEA